MKKKGFTLIELLAVIIILGILMLIAIPSVTSYINNSRKNTYVGTINELIKGTAVKVNSGELDMYDTDTTYYIPTSAIKLESGDAKSPYGKLTDAYVVVTYDGESYDYYFVGKDEKGMGIDEITKGENITSDSIKEVDSVDKTVSITGKSKIVIFDDELNPGESNPAMSSVSEEEGGGSSGGSESGNGGNSGGTTPTSKAASTILATAQEAGQCNQIPDTDICIFKGGANNPPANYVKFNNQDWRIIGIYGDKLKIIKVTYNRYPTGAPSAPSGFQRIRFSTTSNSQYANSSLKESLNTTYYNTLSDEAKAMIDENGSWDVGPVDYEATAYEAYTQATTTSKVASTTHTTPLVLNGTNEHGIGILTSYEYLYATGGGDSCLTTSGFDYNDGCGTMENDWLVSAGDGLWTLSPRCCTAISDDVLFVDEHGCINTSVVGTTDSAVPVVFLKSNVTIVSGDGTDPEHAYILQLNE